MLQPVTYPTAWYGVFGASVLDPVLVLLAEAIVFAAPVALLALWFRGRQAKLDAALVLAAVLASLVISYGLGLLYSHPAPYQAQSDTVLSGPPANAFPSQHATVAFGMVWPLYALGRRRLSTAFFVVAILVSVGRVATGLHYPMDIAGGLLASLLGFGLAWLASDIVVVAAGWVVDIEARVWRTLLDTLR